MHKENNSIFDIIRLKKYSTREFKETIKTIVSFFFLITSHATFLVMKRIKIDCKPRNKSEISLRRVHQRFRVERKINADNTSACCSTANFGRYTPVDYRKRRRNAKVPKTRRLSATMMPMMLIWYCSRCEPRKSDGAQPSISHTLVFNEQG